MEQAITIILPSALHEDTLPNKKFRNNWQTHNLKGSVRAITSFINRQFHPNTYVLREYVKFDSLGNLIETITLAENNRFVNRHTYKYDNAGNYIEKAFYEEDGSLLNTLAFQFDEQGHMLESIKYDRFGMEEEKATFAYDIHGNIIKPTNRYTYDSLGRCTSYEQYTNNSENYYNKSVFNYIDDNTIEETFLRNGGIICWKVRSQYNEKQQLVRRISENIAGNSITNFEDSWEYDASGHLKAYTKKHHGAINKQLSWHSECIYDNNGNWTKNTTYNHDGVLKSNIERDIEYY